MAKDSIAPRPWFLDLVPLLVVLLIAAHVLALVLVHNAERDFDYI